MRISDWSSDVCSSDLSLNLDAATVAGMFAGTITTWNDPAIAALNEGVELPATAVTPVHRQDDSGTTEDFTDYLFQAAPDVWTSEPDGVDRKSTRLNSSH